VQEIHSLHPQQHWKPEKLAQAALKAPAGPVTAAAAAGSAAAGDEVAAVEQADVQEQQAQKQVGVYSAGSQAA